MDHRLNCLVLIETLAESDNNNNRGGLKRLSCLRFHPPPSSLLSEVEATWDCGARSKLSLLLHRTIDANYSEFWERRAGRRVRRGQTVHTSTSNYKLSHYWVSEAGGRPQGVEDGLCRVDATIPQCCAFSKGLEIYPITFGVNLLYVVVVSSWIDLYYGSHFEYSR